VLNNGVTLKFGFGVIQRRLEWRRSIGHYMTFYWSDIVSTCIAVRYIVYHFRVIVE